MRTFGIFLWTFVMFFHLACFFYFEHKEEEHKSTIELIWVGISLIMARIELLMWGGT
jgi:heme/copper-type cytochrome/quinol oxidase subunit 4